MKRYDPVQQFDQGGSGYGKVEECPDGDFVAYDEAAKIIAELERQNTNLREKVKNQAERIRFFEGATNHAGGVKRDGVMHTTYNTPDTWMLGRKPDADSPSA